MKVALVKVPDTALASLLTAIQYPLNLAYLASAAQKAGHEVELWDFCVEAFTESNIRAKINAFKPDVVGLSCVTAAINHGAWIAGIAKKTDPQIATVVGGAHVSALPEQTLEEFPAFDLGVVMEGEDILVDILTARSHGMPLRGLAGTVFRDETGKVTLAPRRANPEINEIPFPNRDLISMDLYAKKHAVRGVSRQFWNVLEVDTARGCPFTCTFCAVAITHGHGVRFRTPENVLAEIRECVKKYKSNFIVFNDSTFTLNKKRIAAIVSALPELGIKAYHVNSHVNSVDMDMLETLARTGCEKVTFGVESGSERTLAAIRKNSTQERIIRAFEMAKKAGIRTVEGSFILGADIHETLDDFRETEKIINILQPDILALGIITPFPGTPQYDEMKQLGYLNGIDWGEYQIFGDRPPRWRSIHFTGDELVAHRNRILKNYYWNLRFVVERLRKIRNRSEMAYYAKMAGAFFRVVVRNS